MRSDDIRGKFQRLNGRQTEIGAMLSRHFEKLLLGVQRGADIGTLQQFMTLIRKRYEAWMAKATEIDHVMTSASPDETRLDLLLDEGLAMADAIAKDLKTFDHRLDALGSG